MIDKIRSKAAAVIAAIVASIAAVIEVLVGWQEMLTELSTKITGG